MARLILFMLLLATVVLAVSVVMSVLKPAGPAPAPQKGTNTMPATFRNFAYVLLLLLMIGVVTGWLGAV
jgi:cell division protein FtsX